MINRRIIFVVGIILVLALGACSKEKSAEEYLEDGRRHLQNQDLSKAIAALEEALKREPSLAEAHRLLGEALGRSDRWPEAIKELEAYKGLAKEEAEAHYLLGQAYVHMGKLDQAAAAFSEGGNLDPSRLSAYREEVDEVADNILQAGQEALEAGDLERATQLLTSVSALVPGQGEVYYLLGQAYQQAGDSIEALKVIAKGVELSPALATELTAEIEQLAQEGIEKGQTAFDTNNLEAASEIIEAVVALQPENAKAHFLLANIYNQSDQLDQAIEAYRTVLSLDPDSASAHTNLGVVYYKQGDLETAIQRYQKALDIEPDDDETHYLLGAAYVQMDKMAEAQSEFEMALELNDQLAPAYIGLGNVYLLQENYELALQNLQKAADLDPNSPEAFFALGQVQAVLGNVEEARAALKHMISLNPAPQWKQQAEAILERLGTQE